MLQAIRSKANSFVVKILFGLLIVTFGLWGIGDIFRSRGADTTVASVGNLDISTQQLTQAVRADMDRLRNMFGGTLDTAQAKQLGIVDAALQHLVSADLIDLEIHRLGLGVGDEAVRNAIIGNPAFHNQAGTFDRNIYASVLAANQMTEPQYEALMRQDLLRDQFASALTDGLTPPKVLVDALFRARFERRVATVLTLPASAAGPAPTPTPAQLEAFYKGHQDNFRTPALRSFKVALLTVDGVAAGITVPADKLQQAYQSDKDQFHTPAQIQLQQMLLPSEAAAKQAETQLAAGKDFATVAKTVAKADPQSLDLGWVKQTDLPKPLADAAFALKQNQVSQPIHSTFGWHILRVTGMKPASVQSFDQVKDKLNKEVSRDMAGDRIAETANHIDDALAGGATLAEVAQKFGLKTVTATDVDSVGQNAQGKPVDLPAPKDKILHTAFATDAGQTSELTEMGDDGYYIVTTDKVTPATVKPLTQVHDAALKAWQTEQQSATLLKLADQIAAAVKGGKSLKSLAAARKLTVTTTAPLLRTDNTAQAPATLVAKLFAAKPGQAVAAAAGQTAVVAELAAIQPADPAKDGGQVKTLSDQLGTGLKEDFLAEFDQALRHRYTVEVNQTNLDHAL